MYLTKFMITVLILIEIDDVSSSLKINTNNDSLYYDNNTNKDYISEVLRRHKRQAVNNGKNCAIPPNPLFTKYVLLGEFETNYTPGDFADQYSNLEIRCNKGYAISPLAAKRLICINGTWSDEPTACLRTCASLISTESTTVTCRYKNRPLKNCINPVKETIAVLTCNTLYEEPSIHKNPEHVCDENRWYPYISPCSPICGIKHPKGVANLVNGKAVQIGDYPWQIGLYYSATKKFFCGGFMVDRNIILTAAHCITDYDGNVQPASDYLVAAGKYFRKYDEDGDLLAQYSNISTIHVPDRYSGRFNMFSSDIAILILSDPFTLTDAVQPVCIELSEVSSYISLSPNDEGIVTGWGYTEEGGQLSDVLKELKIPFIPYNTCFNEIPIDFRKYFTQDKICGGYKDNASSVCRGDSGGALVFKKRDSDRYFVQGIVSTSSATEALTCNANQYSLYTYVNHYYRFIRTIVTANQLRQPIDCDNCADEEPVEERNMLTKRCLLPNMPQHGKYKLVDNTVYTPGNYVPPATEVTLICNDGYTSLHTGTNSSVCTGTGNWQPKLGICEAFSTTTPGSTSISFKSTDNGAGSKSLNSTPKSGHTAAVDENLEKLRPVVRDFSWHENFDLLGDMAIDCGKRIYSFKKRNSNETKTELMEYPWMALLLYDELDPSRGIKCVGTIINERYILTAADCTTYSPDYRLVGVRVGEHNISSNPDCERGSHGYLCTPRVQDIEIEEVIPHPNFDRIYKKHDIALLRVRTPMNFSISVSPICLPIINEYKLENFTDTRLISTGWGFTSLYEKSPSMALLKTEFTVISEKECIGDIDIKINHRYLCAVSLDEDTCEGDAGAPLQGTIPVKNYLQYIQYGIGTFGIPCGTSPGVYTSTDYYMNWILDNIKG